MFDPQITHEDVDALPYVAFGGKITLVKRAADVAAAAEYLALQPVLGYDTETRPSFARGEHYGVSLLQLATAEQAFLFRVDKVGLPLPLLELLQRRQPLKVGVAIGDDIRGLQRIAPFTPQGFVDLQKMAEAYGIQDKALKKVAAIVLGLRISKSQQTSNWGAYSYSAEQKLYAATDAWVCREVYLKLLERSEEIAPTTADAFVDFEKPKRKKRPRPRRWRADGTRRPRPPRRRRRRRRAAAGAAGGEAAPAPPVIIKAP